MRSCVVIACGSKKVDLRDGEEVAAMDLYIGGYFKYCLRFARTFELPIYILSAKYGLIPLDKMLPTYNRRLSECPKKYRTAWYQMVGRDLSKYQRVVCLAGESYSGFEEFCAAKIYKPLKGVGGIGKQMQFIKNLLEDNNE